MTQRILPIFAVALLFAFFMHSTLAATITPSAGLNSYISTYLSNSSLSGATFYNQSVSGSNYVIVRLQNNTYLVIQNTSGTYTLLTNATAIQSVLTPLLTTSFYPNSTTLASLNTSMRTAERYGYANLSDCLVETGLNANTCTEANDCFACKTVPACSKVLNSFGGPDSTFGFGVLNFSQNYTRLNSSYTAYFSLLASINPTNAGTVISQLSTITANISHIYNVMGQNPIFPPPSGQSFGSCNAGANPNTQPWYCVAVGFCSTIPTDTAQISTLASMLSSLQKQLPSAAGIASISANSSTAATAYMNAYLSGKNGVAFTALITSITPKINAVVNSSNLLLARYDNSSLSASISALKLKFSTVENAGVNQSIPLANTTLNAYLSNSLAAYAAANASYNQVYLLSQNNSAKLLADELSYPQVPTSLAKIANQQQIINTQINSGINSTSAQGIHSQLQSISVESAIFIAPLTVGYMIKVLDGSFISAMLGPSDISIPAKEAAAPIYAAIESLIIGILILIVVAIIAYLRVVKKGKLKNNKRAQRMWMGVFIVLIILVILYTYATYAFAQSATTFLPFNYFVNSVKASPSVYIALNESAASNASIGQCTNTIQSYLTKASKTVQVIKLENYSCLSGSNISVLGLNCYNTILQQDKPVIFVSQISTSNITYKGLYGTVLYANGNVAAGPDCTLGTLFRNT
jgi:hypothetical protein